MAKIRVEDLVDADIWEYVKEQYMSRSEAFMIQLLRELKKEGPEEKSKPVRGFGPDEFTPF